MATAVTHNYVAQCCIAIVQDIKNAQKQNFMDLLHCFKQNITVKAMYYVWLNENGFKNDKI